MVPGNIHPKPEVLQAGYLGPQTVWNSRIPLQYPGRTLGTTFQVNCFLVVGATISSQIRSQSRRDTVRSNRLCVAEASVIASATWPAEVEGYQCRRVSACVPEVGEVAALIVDEDGCSLPEEELKDLPDWVPQAWLSPVVGDKHVCDIYGAIGVWPAAFVAAEEVSKLLHRHSDVRQVAELGCGAGFPSLVAARMGASVHAVDIEPLPLALLQAAFKTQQSCNLMPTGAQLETFCEDACAYNCARAEIIIVSDLLYSKQLGSMLGTQVGHAAKQGSHIVVVDGRRSGRESFLTAFQEAAGLHAWFEDLPVPQWAPASTDFFDDKICTSIGVLQFGK